MTKRKPRKREAMHVMVCNDVHWPFHDAFAWAAFRKRLVDKKPDLLVINGDFADFASVSLHEDGAPTPDFVDECAQVVAALEDLRAIMGSRPIHYCEGNHENRLTRYIAKKAAKLAGAQTWQSALHLQRLAITATAYGEAHKVGRLAFTHGVYHGDLYTKQHLIRYGTSVVIGHCHRAQIYTMPVAGEAGAQHVRGAFGIPCLAPVDRCNYIKGPTGWTQGHGEFWIEQDGSFSADVVIYHEQRFWRDGVCYDGRE